MAERAKQIEQVASLSIIALLIIGSIVVVLPFLPAILWAVVSRDHLAFFYKSRKGAGGRATWPQRSPPFYLL